MWYNKYVIKGWEHPPSTKRKEGIQMKKLIEIYKRYKTFKMIGIHKPLHAALDKKFAQGGIIMKW